MLVINIVNNLTANHFELAGSVPLLPFTKGRDVLVFQSLPSSGLTAQDSYDAKRYNYDEATNPGGPTTAGTQGEKARTSTRPPRPPAATAMTRLRRLSDLTLRRHSSNGESPNRCVRAAPSSGAGINTQEGTPKAKNVLLKKNSTRRKNVLNMPASTADNHVGNGQSKRASAPSFVPSRGHVQGSDDTAGFAQGDAHLRVMNSTSQDRNNWSFVEHPTVLNQEGRAPPIGISRIFPTESLWNAPLALCHNTNRDPIQFGTTQLFVPPGTGHAPDPNLSQDSGDSMYIDPPVAGGKDRCPSLDNVRIPQANLYSSTTTGIGGFHDFVSSDITQPFRLGHPMRTPSPSIQSRPKISHTIVPAPQFTSLPVNNPNGAATMKDRGSPKRNRPAVVVPDMTGIGRVNSMHGSVGWNGSALSRGSRDHQPPHSSLNNEQSGPGRESQQGSVAMLVNAQGYGGSLQFPGSPTSPTTQAEKVGSARTKVNVGPRHWET